ncbi:MAG: N-acetyltransferase [Wenzhouxiangella sp.]|nr:MAG: N-acetyltransferase [Wenzhouxiangella sp.]
MPVCSRRDWQSFHAFPGRIYADDPHWVKPLLLESRALWSPRTPWFEHARAQAFLAWRDQRPVGRISAQVDDLQPLEQGRKIGYFGQFECLDDREIARAMFAQAGRWLSRHGCERVRGPYDLGINQACGLLVEGRDSPPMIMMGHAPAYYQGLIEDAGLAREMDLLAYLLPPDFDPPQAMVRLLERSARRVRLRPMDFSNFKNEISVLRDIFNDAWSANWGFVPLTRAEFKRMGDEMRKILKPAYTCLAEVDGEPAGFLVALPNLNELIRDLDGRLLPTGWARLLWRLARNRASSARVPLMGVRQVYQRGALGAAISFGMIDAVRRALHADGIRRVEVSWILETNRGMNSMIEAMGGQLYKRYRLYGRALT